MTNETTDLTPADRERQARVQKLINDFKASKPPTKPPPAKRRPPKLDTAQKLFFPVHPNPE